MFGGLGGSGLGVVRAKTGNLSTVATLAGLVYDSSGRVLGFAFMTNGVPAAKLGQAARGSTPWPARWPAADVGNRGPVLGAKRRSGGRGSGDSPPGEHEPGSSPRVNRARTVEG